MFLPSKISKLLDQTGKSKNIKEDIKKKQRKMKKRLKLVPASLSILSWNAVAVKWVSFKIHWQ